jgi:hypothetical protein
MDKISNPIQENFDMQEIMTHVGEVIKVIGVGGGNRLFAKSQK